MSFLNKLLQPDVEKLKAKGDIEGLINALGYKKSIGVRCIAAKALGLIGGVRAVQPILITFKEINPADWAEKAMFQGFAVSALANIGIAAVAPLIATLQDPDQSVQEFATDALAKIGTPAVGPLIAALRDENLCEAAEKALAKIGTPAVEPLISALKDTDKAMCALSAMALGEIKDAHAVEPLITALTDSDEVVRIHAAEALRSINDTRALEPLITALKDNGEYVRVGAAQALGVLMDARAVEPLINALKDSSMPVRKSVVWALAQIKDTRAVEPLKVALVDSDENVRKLIARELGESFDQPTEATTGGRGICDLCSTPLGPDAKGYSSSQVKTAVRSGLRPPESTYQLGAAFGMSRSQTEANWVEKVMQDETDWLLCPACAAKAAPYLTR